MSTTREAARVITDWLHMQGFIDKGHINHRSITDKIDKALQAERERGAKIAENALPIGADDCDSCERIRRIVAAIREGKPQ